VVPFLVGARDISLLYSIQTSSGVQTASRTMIMKSCFPGVKWQGLEADHSSPSSAEVKNGGTMLPLPHTFSLCDA
jgi:hypothetical protein